MGRHFGAPAVYFAGDAGHDRAGVGLLRFWRYIVRQSFVRGPRGFGGSASHKRHVDPGEIGFQKNRYPGLERLGDQLGGFYRRVFFKIQCHLDNPDGRSARVPFLLFYP